MMKPRKGTKKNRAALPPPLLQQQGANGRSDSDSTLAGSASSDDGSPIGRLAGRGQVTGSIVMAPSYYVLPPTQARLLRHMSGIMESMEAGCAGDLVIYLKRLPT